MVFGRRDSGLGLISSMKLDGRKDIQSVKSAQSILHFKLNARALSPVQENDKGRETNTGKFNKKHTK